MNEQLKFSWGHIIAFLAIILLSYATFVGTTYLTGGNFWAAGICMIITDAVLLSVFLGAQMAKAASSRFGRMITVERLLIIFSPLVFLLSLLPYSHFWTVHTRNDAIVAQFKEAVNASRQLFTDYDRYAATRLAAYDSLLTSTIDHRSGAPSLAAMGLTEEKKRMQKTNMEQTLKLQLLAANYDSLKLSANAWIDKAGQGASTWNVFLLGNTVEIKRAIHQWNKQLTDYAAPKLSNEELGGNQVKPFNKWASSQARIDARLDRCTALFTETGFGGVEAIVVALLLYGALLLPYLLQERHTKSLQRLTGKEKRVVANEQPAPQLNKRPVKKAANNKSGDDFDAFRLE